jgi:competence protein ComEC
MDSISTRFRAYQLGSAGSSFSYFANGHFTMMEGRLTEQSRPSVIREMELCGVTSADTLHLTSWDADHCAASELEELLALISPDHIECPGYDPHCDHAENAAAIIEAYRDSHRKRNRPVTLSYITPRYIGGLASASVLAFKNIFYHPTFLDEASNNNNSTVKFFRRGSFNVLSLGDVESVGLSARLRRSTTLCRETDVMILAHHGADNGFTNKKLLQRLEPSLAICSSDYDNQHGHPDDAVRELLQDQGVALMTTKTGDVIVRSINDHTGDYVAVNLKKDSTEDSSNYSSARKKRNCFPITTIPSARFMVRLAAIANGSRRWRSCLL